jgi:transcription elongation GreA/GreB family factor
VLERAGWTFWRCWGATFYREPDSVLSELFDKLTEMGITPTGRDTEIQNGCVEIREVYGLAENETLQTKNSANVDSEINDELSDPLMEYTESSIFEDRSADSGESTGDQEMQDLRNDKLSLPIEVTSVENNDISSSNPGIFIEEGVCVELNDSVSYCFLDDETEIKTIQIVNGPNQPEMGIININAPLARALIRAEVEEEIEIHLPTGTKKARVINIEKA